LVFSRAHSIGNCVAQASDREPGTANLNAESKGNAMKTSRLLAAAALSLIAAAGAHAENYDGVQAPVSAMSRADVEAEAVRAASAPNQNVTRGSRGPDPFKSVADPVAVRAQAVATANAPDQNVTSGSRVNSRVISNMPNPAAVQAQKDGAATAK
jgi:hypothetical protein